MTSALLVQTLVVSCVPLLLAAVVGLVWRFLTKDRRREAVETRRVEARTRQIEADVSAQIRDSLVLQVKHLTEDRQAMEREIEELHGEVRSHEESLAQCRRETAAQKAELAMQATAIGSSVAKITMLQAEIMQLKEHLAGCPKSPKGGAGS